MGLWCSVSHMVACSVFYKANVIGDHDTFEVSITNHYEGKEWLRLQVQNSGNFKTDSSLHTSVFGGINYPFISEYVKMLLLSDFTNSSAILQGE